ncbi:hypothetical protein SAMN05444411_102529 [Lutibacter oricola]|uniref:DUF4258 domain-containing protein n=1 Tax=Lutibacter oricola TaxID=762486 RepID=A0A1H2XPD7_9FLAO|nr:hypothetical protein [Lutibacter oricola]SDW94771.1 hypothetical protein SAMN05444411_102529 [Lutibacter oricola]
MTFKQRLPYYLFGLLIGTIAVVFIWNKKGTEFSYGPNARVLKNIRIKDRVFSEKALEIIALNKVDTASISKILRKGNVDMWNKTKIDDCTQYSIQGKKELKNVTLVVKNCDSTAFIEEITFQ